MCCFVLFFFFKRILAGGAATPTFFVSCKTFSLRLFPISAAENVQLPDFKNKSVKVSFFFYSSFILKPLNDSLEGRLAC